MKLIVALFALVFAGCAAQPAKLAETSWPEAVFPTDRQATADWIITSMTGGSAMVEDISPAIIQLRMEDPGAAMAKAFFGCPACADPYIRANFMMAETGDGTRVVAQYWRVVPKFGGAEERLKIKDAKSFNQMQEALWKLRDTMPPVVASDQ